MSKFNYSRSMIECYEKARVLQRGSQSQVVGDIIGSIDEARESISHAVDRHMADVAETERHTAIAQMGLVAARQLENHQVLDAVEKVDGTIPIERCRRLVLSLLLHGGASGSLGETVYKEIADAQHEAFEWEDANEAEIAFCDAFLAARRLCLSLESSEAARELASCCFYLGLATACANR